MRRKLLQGLLDGSHSTEDKHPLHYGQFQLAQEQSSYSSLHSVINEILNRLLNKLKPLEPQLWANCPFCWMQVSNLDTGNNTQGKSAAVPSTWGLL